MQFDDGYERASLEFVLDTVFHHVPAGTRTTGDLAGQPYDEFWWREQAVGRYGTRGYVLVWLNGNKFNSHHTYHHPESIYT